MSGSSNKSDREPKGRKDDSGGCRGLRERSPLPRYPGRRQSQTGQGNPARCRKRTGSFKADIRPAALRSDARRAYRLFSLFGNRGREAGGLFQAGRQEAQPGESVHGSIVAVLQCGLSSSPTISLTLYQFCTIMSLNNSLFCCSLQGTAPFPLVAFHFLTPGGVCP